MREIKFRAWDTIHKKMSGTFTLLDCINDNQVFCCPENFDFMQYTGLKDKNGKEIYEGDIVQGSADRDTIEWDIDMWITKPLSQGRGFLRLSEDYPAEDLKVIGNIYENPELLNKGDK